MTYHKYIHIHAIFKSPKKSQIRVQKLIVFTWQAWYAYFGCFNLEKVYYFNPIVAAWLFTMYTTIINNLDQFLTSRAVRDCRVIFWLILETWMIAQKKKKKQNQIRKREKPDVHRSAFEFPVADRLCIQLNEILQKWVIVIFKASFRMRDPFSGITSANVQTFREWIANLVDPTVIEMLDYRGTCIRCIDNNKKVTTCHVRLSSSN